MQGHPSRGSLAINVCSFRRKGDSGGLNFSSEQRFLIESVLTRLGPNDE